MDKNLELIKLAQQGDESAVEQIINENCGLIWSIVKKFTNRGVETEDLFQLGVIGIIKCVKKFNMDFDVKFSTYAVPMIMGEIKRYLRDDGIIKVSRPLKEIYTKAKYLQDTITKNTGRSPTVQELANKLEVEVEDLIMAMDANQEVESLYSTANHSDGSPVYLIDKLNKSEDDNEKIVENIMIKDTLATLGPREQKIIELRYYQDKTQSEVAKEIGVSQVQVSRLEKKVLLAMREKML